MILSYLPPCTWDSSLVTAFSRIKDKIARAERLDLPTRSCARGGARGGPSRAAAEAAEALKQAAAARSKREIDARRVKLTMVRSKHRRHVFHTKLGSRVGAIEEACREQVALVSRDEQGADLCLYHEVRHGIRQDRSRALCRFHQIQCYDTQPSLPAEDLCPNHSRLFVCREPGPREKQSGYFFS